MKYGTPISVSSFLWKQRQQDNDNYSFQHQHIINLNSKNQKWEETKNQANLQVLNLI